MGADGKPWVAYMGLACQNVSIAECGDVTCATSTATLVAGDLQTFDPTSNSVYRPILAAAGGSATSVLVAFSSGDFGAEKANLAFVNTAPGQPAVGKALFLSPICRHENLTLPIQARNKFKRKTERQRMVYAVRGEENLREFKVRKLAFSLSGFS